MVAVELPQPGAGEQAKGEDTLFTGSAKAIHGVT